MDLYEFERLTGIVSRNREPPDKKSIEQIEKSELKKRVKQALEKNTKLNKFLEEKHVKGRFIRSAITTINRSSTNFHKVAKLNALINDTDPINNCVSWGSTTEGYRFWDNLRDEYINK